MSKRLDIPCVAFSEVPKYGVLGSPHSPDPTPKSPRLRSAALVEEFDTLEPKV